MSFLTVVALLAGFGIFALAFVVARKVLEELERQPGPRRRPETPDPGHPPDPPTGEG